MSGEKPTEAPKCAINSERLWSSIMGMAALGGLPGGGCDRQALTDTDRAARDLFVEWARAAGCAIKIDQFGNIFAIRPGARPEAPAVLLGSHLDTQPHGGRFDGIYGVMAGLEVVRAMNDAQILTESPIAVVNWTNEEGVRFAPGLTGSKGFAGILPPSAIADMRSRDGARFTDELERIGYRGDMSSSTLPVAAYLEAHIEQGPVLERAGTPIGVVTGVQGVRWFQLTVEGADRHAGTTSMDVRRDSFMATARIILELRNAALQLSGDVRFTAGRVNVMPGSTNTVPGKTVVEIDLRHPDEIVLDRMEVLIAPTAARIALEERCIARVERTMDVRPVHFDSRIVDSIAAAAAGRNERFTRLASGAMHDASSIAQIAPSAMVFVPCRDGISHAEEEWAEPEHLAIGCAVLADAACNLARVVP